MHNNIPIVTEAFVAHLLDHGAVPSSMISEFAWAPPESGISAQCACLAWVRVGSHVCACACTLAHKYSSNSPR